MSKPLGMGIEYGWRGTVIINAKNLMGAYGGAKEYMYIIRDGQVVVLTDAFRTE